MRRDTEQQLVTRPGWEWLADDPFPHWRRWSDGACVWESHGEWVVHLDDDDSPDHEAATAVEAMAWADHEHGLRSCSTDTCNGRGFIECWNPGGLCPTPNDPGCDLCGSCNECAAARGDDDRAG